MARTVRIGNREVGEGQACFVIAVIGINHNGDLELAKRLIDAAKDSGADAVKFQKRTVEVVFTPDELARPRESPFRITNRDLKRGLEFRYEPSSLSFRIIRSAILGTRSGYRRRWPRRPWVPAWWSGTSPWTARCGAAIRRRLWSRRASNGWCGTSARLSPRWGTA